jgi:hypothetical protein
MLPNHNQAAAGKIRKSVFADGKKSFSVPG